MSAEMETPDGSVPGISSSPAPTQSTREKLVEVSELVVDHVLALLRNSEPGTINAFGIKTCLQLLKNAGLSPTQADEERARAKREAAMSLPFADRDAGGTEPRMGGASAGETAGGCLLSDEDDEDLGFPDDPQLPAHLRRPRRADGTKAAGEEGVANVGP